MNEQQNKIKNTLRKIIISAFDISLRMKKETT
jgi:hypothetical protein